MKSFILLFFVFCYFCVNTNDAVPIDDDDDNNNVVVDSKNSKILNGIIAIPGQFPYSVQVHPSACGGSIIQNNKWIITAAHCLPVPVSGFACRTLNNGVTTNCGSFQSSNIHYLPEYYPGMNNVWFNDLALIELDNYLSDVPGFHPIQIMYNNFNLQLNETVYFAGFGISEIDWVPDDGPNYHLKYGWFGIEGFPTINDVENEERAIALYNYPFAGAEGDSGSGYIVIRQGIQYLIGVHSASSGLGGISVGTFLDSRLNWLHSILPPPLPPTQTTPSPTVSVPTGPTPSVPTLTPPTAGPTVPTAGPTVPTAGPTPISTNPKKYYINNDIFTGGATAAAGIISNNNTIEETTAADVERIQNGIIPYLGQFPHSIVVFPYESNTRCSGSIIHTNKWIITAAHCFRIPRPGIACRSLETYDQSHCMSFQVSNLHFVPGWYAETTDLVQFDIVLIELDEFFPELTGFGPAKIMNEHFDLQKNELIYVTGFGQYQPGQSSYWSRYGIMGFGELRYDDRTIILTQYEFAILSGDSGGGIGVIRDNVYYLIATTSSTAGLGSIGVGTYYLRNLPWIQETLASTFETNNGCPVPACLTAGFANYPATNPHQVWMCSNFVAYLLECDGGLFWNQEVGGCASWGQADCTIAI